MAISDTRDTATVIDTPKGNLFGGPFNSTGLDPNVRAVLMDYRWTTTFGGSQPATTITYAFPTSKNDYLAVPNYPAAGNLTSFQPLTDIQKAAVKAGFGLVASYTNLTFVESASGLATNATFRFANFNGGGSESRFPPNRGPYAPTDSRDAGDTFLGKNGNPTSVDFYGTDEFNTIIHEMGHAFGLKHGHDSSFNGALAPNVNDNEFSVMTYASYLGANTGLVTTAIEGSAPQSYMMYDIAALQAYYGANFSKAGSNAVYSWDATGQEFINGQPAPNTGASSTNKIFTTVWTQGATATYDFHNFSQDATYDLRPGHWSTFSKGQLADLNSAAPAGTPQYQAQGNVYNALLYNGDQRSEVKNVVAGTGNDVIVGNDLDNVITGGAGNDRIDGGPGSNSSVYTGTEKNYAVTIFAGHATFEITDKFGTDGTDSLVNIQRLQFTDAAVDPSSFAEVAAANAVTFVPLDALYASYLQRAPDALGLDYWIARVHDGMDLRQVAKSFALQPEAHNALPANGTPEQIVTAAYRDALGRAPDADGLHYWVGELQKGTFDKGDLMLGIINAAISGEGDDAKYVNNRASVGGHFALGQGLGRIDWATAAMTGVDGTAESVTAANARTDAFAAAAAAAGTTEFIVKLVGVAFDG
jgi:serralysin